MHDTRLENLQRRRNGRRLAGLTIATGILLATGSPQALSAADPQNERAQADESSSSTTGAVVGRIVYHSDSKRPWRYSRYYVRDRKKGYLAEAVVCLDGPRARSAAPQAGDPATVTIDQKDFRFIPETVAVRAGDRIRFTNSDPQVHNVFSALGPGRFDSTLPTGGEFFETLDRAGGPRRPIVVGCKFHGSMRAWIYVFDHPFFQVTEADGRYRIENVPPGKYRLSFVHPAGSLARTETVEIRAGETAEHDIHVSPDNKIGS